VPIWGDGCLNRFFRKVSDAKADLYRRGTASNGKWLVCHPEDKEQSFIK
jgi:hypothetical protein